MQILPLIQSRTASATADAALTGGAGLGSRQSAIFASILDTARASSSAKSAAKSAMSLATDQSQDREYADVTEAAAAPNEDDLKTLPLTREDIAALRTELKDQGFTDEELDAMEERAGDGTGMTWGELMTEVEKKVATTEKSEKKTIANDDQVQLLGLLGKLGFSQEQSQQMLDALSRGETQSVWTSINEKLDGLSGDESFHVSSSEMTALGRAMNLSEDAQSRLAALFEQSGAEAGLSGQGIVTAMGLVKNELVAQIGKENQALADFREAASSVLANAWQRETTGRDSDLYQDDVARKAGQIVAMSNEQDGTDTAGAADFDALADVPLAGEGTVVESGTSQGQSEASEQSGQAEVFGQTEQTELTEQTEQTEQTELTELTEQTGQTRQAAQTELTGQARQAGQTEQTGQTETPRPAVTAELAAKAGAVAAEQASLAGQGGETTATPAPVQAEIVPSAAAKTVTTASPGIVTQDAAQFSGGQQGASGENAFGQSSQEGSMAELMSKIRFGGRTGTVQTTATAETTPAMAAMDALKTSSTSQQAKTFDPALAARVARQVETGILKGVDQEARQLTLNLTPDELGPLQVTLTVKDKEIRAVITADNADTAAILQDQAAAIKQTLEDQGFKVTKLDVQTGLAQDNQTAAWDSPERHNEAREQREALERIRSSVRLAREAAASDVDSAAIPGAMTARAAGLDLFA
jgi:flagellar hook-length control protein FliK